MKKTITVALVVVLAVAALIAALPLALSSQAVKQPIADQLANWTGRRVTFVGDPRVSVFPYLKIWVPNVAVAGPAGAGGEAFVSAETISGTVRLLPLLLGRIEVVELGLRGATVRLKSDAAGHPNWLIGPAPAAAAGRKALSRYVDLRLARLKVRDSTIVYDDGKGREERFLNASLAVAWPAVDEPATGVGAFRWRDETVEFNGSIGAPLDFVSGRLSAVRFALASTLLRLSVTGDAVNLGGISLQGSATISTPSLRRLLAWTGTPTEPGSTLGAASIDGEVDWSRKSISFSQARAELDGNQAEGALIVELGAERPRIRATLDFAKLDLSPYIDRFRAAGGPGGWISAPIALPLLQLADLDIRLSTEETLLGSARLGRTAATLTTSPDKVAIDVTEAQLYGGRLTGRLSGARVDGAVDAEVAADLKDVPLGVALQSIAGVKSVEGTGTASLALSGRGATVNALLHGLAGTVKVAASDGTIAGLDIDRLAARLGRGAADDGGDGQTAFTSLTASLGIAAGTLSTHDLAVEGAGYRIDMDGEASLFESTVSGRGELALTGKEVDPSFPNPLPFELSGTWTEPELLPDFQRLIRRSSSEGRGLRRAEASQPPAGKISPRT
jgi:AsmA protein